MKLADYLGDLDPELARKLSQAVSAVQEEFEEKLSSTVQTVVTDAAERAAAEAAERAAAEAAAKPAPAREIATTALSLDAADELRMATIDIDAASSQAEILEALSRGLLRFASRVAVFVHRGEEAHGWSSSGFENADAGIRQVVLPLERLFPEGPDRDEGSLALSSAECAVLCDALDSNHPSMGLLMPFVLGSQVVGTVYCDRVGSEPFSVSALQVLTFIAGETLETLPVRKRSSTATLNLVGSAPATEAAPTEAAQEEEEEEEIAAGEEPSEQLVETSAETQVEPDTVPQVEPDAVPQVEVDAELQAEPDVLPVSDFETEVAASVDMPEPSNEIQPAPLPEVAPVASVLADPPVAPDLYPEPEPPAKTEDEEATRPGHLPSELAATPEPDSATEAAPTGPTEPTPELGSTEVSPPEDLEGPGWAFTGASSPNEGSSDSEHEEAQRLARLLVTEIKLYNEEAVEEGRRNASVYSRLREDIDRSRQIFEDRIDEEVRAENDYFKQALVRILAGGDPSLLGI